MAFGGSAPAAWPALWASLGIILVSWITAWLIFLRQEL